MSLDKVEEIKARLATAKSEYLAVSDEATSVWRPRSDAVKALMRELSAAIAEGAADCPECGIAPHGMEHQVARGRTVGVEYEVGCLGCTRRARGGTLPHHAVELWNAKIAQRVG